MNFFKKKNKKKEINLFLNGTPPIFNKKLLNRKIFAVDGAYSYLINKNIYIDYLSGDFDSINRNKNILVKKKIFFILKIKKKQILKKL
ncbi:motility associated factor glycosyltransferase family protein [Blattabacterium cuenoti]|uniref:hypothetical protein n=1 Tax=Blattabacterium cuenoti TaxID=1653831 RepID=UPI001EEBFF54|nr:hypothetical protein [Blattabacterium cuenoti]